MKRLLYAGHPGHATACRAVDLGVRLSRLWTQVRMQTHLLHKKNSHIMSTSSSLPATQQQEVSSIVSNSFQSIITAVAQNRDAWLAYTTIPSQGIAQGHIRSSRSQECTHLGRDCDPRLAKIFLDVSATHYPERLAVFIIVSPPSVFSVLWRAIQGMVDPATKRKIRFVKCGPFCTRTSSHDPDLSLEFGKRKSCSGPLHR